uniref:CSC1/OSCA1-like cytosolic domain-containing protein n=1 Tax=Hippocampus comes TaxID=109280 RepID=A0A3Q3DXQ0_HIPCM
KSPRLLRTIPDKEKVHTKPLGMAFVTFQNEATTAIILKDFNACQVQGCRCRQEPRSSQFGDALHVHDWNVSYAPDPQNVRWWVPVPVPIGVPAPLPAG